MCNLYRMTSNVEAIARLFNVDTRGVNLPAFPAIYPDREAPVVRQDAGGARHLEIMRWGFPPPPGVARANPERRCLVPVTAFSEWSAAPDPATGKKRIHWFGMADPEDVPFAFAGLWRPNADEAPRMAFLTCAPNALVGAVHPKAMPVIVPRDDYADWLEAPLDVAKALAQPFDDPRMTMVEA
jgi:putative SOS response-associated peptidase YedK